MMSTFKVPESDTVFTPVISSLYTFGSRNFSSTKTEVLSATPAMITTKIAQEVPTGPHFAHRSSLRKWQSCIESHWQREHIRPLLPLAHSWHGPGFTSFQTALQLACGLQSLLFSASGVAHGKAPAKPSEQTINQSYNQIRTNLPAV
eukprot:TRINITY_DN7016_c0_g2_i1.p1 TRINITY_DN7016_c0_g2~~TRINITY_DN7016_c0_g2_i1.p1  ORF type:complete len:147 (+),score=13.37 TRINITY_DN7016_c0_g2_i1:158-598(+)